MHRLEPLQHALARIRALLDRGEHDGLPELVRHYLAQVEAACTDAAFCPEPEPLRRLLAEHQEVMAQMRARRQVLAQSLHTHRQSARAAHAYRAHRTAQGMPP